MKPPMTIRIRGTIYPSAHAAAAALGIRPVTVYSALSRGAIDGAGIGAGRGRRKQGHSVKSKPVTIAGETFASMNAASVALGFGPQYLGNVLDRGKDRARTKLQAAAMLYAARRDGRAAKERANA